MYAVSTHFGPAIVAAYSAATAVATAAAAAPGDRLRISRDSMGCRESCVGRPDRGPQQPTREGSAHSGSSYSRQAQNDSGNFVCVTLHC